MQRPPKRKPANGARYSGLTPSLVKERVPVTYSPTGAIQHPGAPYTFINHNSRSTMTGDIPSSSPGVNAPGGESHGSVITFGGAAVPGEDSLAPLATRTPVPRGTPMPAFGHQPRVSRGPSVPVQLGVEGVRTGEEVVIEAAPPRIRSSIDDGGASSSAELEALKRKLTSSREECKSLQEKLQKRKQEASRTQRISVLMSDEAEQRLGLVMKAHTSREVLCADFVHHIMRLAVEGRHAQHRLHESQISALQAQSAQDRASFETRLAELDKDLQVSREATKQTETRDMADLHAQIESLRAELISAREQHAREAQTIEARLMSTQHDLHTTQKSLQEKLVLIAANDLLVAQCRQFVLSICHPGFSVVKDESLEPVDKNRGEPSGFVLIPLIVLLHGYALLPESERRDVIETYEKKTESLR